MFCAPFYQTFAKFTQHASIEARVSEVQSQEIFPVDATANGIRRLPVREFFTLDIRSLALMRIGLAVVLLIDWLDRLPAMLAACEERWNLTIGAPVGNLSFNYVAPAVLNDGTEVMVKTGLTDEFPSQLRGW